jgi:Tol biopolymer transport system component
MTSATRSTAGRTAALALITFAGLAPLHAADKPAVTIFAPGPIPTTAAHSVAPAFTPDGDTVYLGQQATSTTSIVIMSSQKKDGVWSAPTLAPFSGQFRDLEPAFAPNGKYLIFASSRPIIPIATELEGHYNDQTLPGRGGYLWKVERTKKGWGKPEVLPESINSNTSVFSPAITADGSLYFMRCDDGKDFHIFRSQMKHGQLQPPVRASFSNRPEGDYDPAVAPDDSYIIFSSSRAPAPPNKADLFIAFRTPQGWGDPIDLRTLLSDEVYGIEARLSPDGKTLYFSNSRGPSGAEIPHTRSIWQVDISSILQNHKTTASSGQ